jgi:hypothetical protein
MAIKRLGEPSDCCILCSMNLAVQSVTPETKRLWGPVVFLNISYWGGGGAGSLKMTTFHRPLPWITICWALSPRPPVGLHGVLLNSRDTLSVPCTWNKSVRNYVRFQLCRNNWSNWCGSVVALLLNGLNSLVFRVSVLSDSSSNWRQKIFPSAPRGFWGKRSDVSKA